MGRDGTVARKVTMRDVARRAGVSVSTVSFVINGRRDKRVAEETWARVLKAVDDLGFRPDQTARSLRLRRSLTIGMITDEIASTPFAGRLVHGAQELAWASGRLLFLINSERDEALETAAVEALLDRQVDGLVYAAQSARDVQLPPAFTDVPCMLLNCFSSSSAVPSVGAAERYGGALAARALLDAGHRRVAFFPGDATIWASAEREVGFREALLAAGVAVGRGSIVEGDYTVDSGYRRATDVLARDDRPTGIVCANDRVAVGVLLAASERGLRVPADVSVVGYDNEEEIAGQMRPRLTTVSLPHYDIGRVGLGLLLDRLEGRRVPVLTEVKGALVVRDTVAPPSTT